MLFESLCFGILCFGLFKRNRVDEHVYEQNDKAGQRDDKRLAEVGDTQLFLDPGKNQRLNELAQT